MEVSGDIIAGKKVLLVWHGECNAERMKETVEDLRSKAGQGGSVLLEHAERLIMGIVKFVRGAVMLIMGI